jgi:hypothetical protein
LMGVHGLRNNGAQRAHFTTLTFCSEGG